jgi:hypothetical protein
MSLDWTNAEYADGPKLAAWLADEGYTFDKNLHPTEDRAIRYWLKGRAAKLATVDAVLCKVGRHICELPDEVWCEKPLQHRPRIPAGVKEEAIRRLREGSTVEAEARRIGCSPKTVQQWSTAAGVAEEKRKAHERRKQAVLAMLRSGNHRMIDVHRETGVSLSTIDRWRTAA